MLSNMVIKLFLMPTIVNSITIHLLISLFIAAQFWTQKGLDLSSLPRYNHANSISLPINSDFEISLTEIGVDIPISEFCLWLPIAPWLFDKPGR